MRVEFRKLRLLHFHARGRVPLKQNRKSLVTKVLSPGQWSLFLKQNSSSMKKC